MLTEGGLSAAAAADRFSRNVSLFGRVLKGMREGDARLGIDRVNIADSAGKQATSPNCSNREAETARIVEKSPELVKVQNAARSIADKGDTLLEATPGS
ncbi:MAG: hypothetical protein IPL99_14545 [Candidatus Competibacteraceae bacterium]|nr:hypothetical protein [Candidatus Competibacteraceae bacterium]